MHERPPLWRWSAVDLAAAIAQREISCVEAVTAAIERMHAANPQVNAVTVDLSKHALEAAKRADAIVASGVRLGPLHGVPVTIKENVDQAGQATPTGLVADKDLVAKTDSPVVANLRKAGAIIIGRSNTPEFGYRWFTDNPLRGLTRNPWSEAHTPGGSSGGAAAAVACGMLPFADGSDLAASLRNPGNYCNVVGFRPTPGRVPSYPAANAWDTQSVLGPVARTVEDAAFLLSAMAGPDRRAPVSIAEPGSIFAKPLKRSFKKVRMAWTKDFGGLPVEPAVSAVLEAQRRVFQDLGCIVEEACPDFSGATEAFETLRAVSFALRYARYLKTHRAELKATVIWNIEQGLALDGAKIARAEVLRTELYQRLRAFLETYEFLLAPVSQLPPFPVETEYPTEIAGVKLTNYLDWMKSCYYITIASHPAISVPAGFTPAGLPVGLQVIGRYRDDFGVLQLAHAFEQETQAWKRRPPLAG